MNNWLGPIFFSLGDSHTKGSLVLLHPGFEGITEAVTDPKRGGGGGGVVSFKVTPLPLMTEFSAIMPLQGIAPGNNWLEGISVKDYKVV